MRRIRRTGAWGAPSGRAKWDKIKHTFQANPRSGARFSCALCHQSQIHTIHFSSGVVDANTFFDELVYQVWQNLQPRKSELSDNRQGFLDYLKVQFDTDYDEFQ